MQFLVVLSIWLFINHHWFDISIILSCVFSWLVTDNQIWVFFSFVLKIL